LSAVHVQGLGVHKKGELMEKVRALMLSSISKL